MRVSRMSRVSAGEGDHGRGRRGGLGVQDMERLELGAAVAQHALVGDRVPAIDRLGLMPDHRHRRRARHARPLEVAHGGPAKVVGDPARQACQPAGGRPRAAKALDGLPVAVKSQGTTRPVASSTAWVWASWASRTARSRGVSGNIRPFRFFVSPGSRRSQPAARSTCARWRVRSSDFTRQPVRYATSNTGRRSTERCGATAAH
jgi:hypothetical protein